MSIERKIETCELGGNKFELITEKNQNGTKMILNQTIKPGALPWVPFNFDTVDKNKQKKRKRED